MQRCHLLISVLVFLFINVIPSMAQNPDRVKEMLARVGGQELNTEIVDTLLEYSSQYWNRDLDSSLILGKAAYDAAEKLNYRAGMADALYKRSVAFRNKGDRQEAINEATKSLLIAEEIRDSTLSAKLNYQMATIYRSMSNKKVALEYYNKALSTYLALKSAKNLIAVYNGMGNYFQDVGAYQSALVHYQKALEFAIDLNLEKNQGLILGNIGNVYKSLNHYEMASRYLFKAYEIAEKYQTKRELSNILNRMGGIAYDQGNYRLADSLFERSAILKNEISDMDGLANIMCNKAMIARELGNYDEALSNYNTAMDFYRENDISEGMIVVWHGIADYYFISGNYQMALQYYDSCMQMSIKVNDLKRLEETYLSLHNVFEATGNIQNALKYYKLYDEIGDSINSIEKNQLLYQLDLMGEKEKRDLEKFIRQEEHNSRMRQRNAFTYAIVGLVVLAIYLVIFFRYRARKNQVIAEQKVKQLEEEKKLLAARFIVEGQEEERKRIATELHDGLGALLSVTKMQFTAIKDVKPENKSHYEKVAQFLEQASGDVRKISHNMMPGLLTKLGLCEALEDLFETLNDSEGMDARLEIVGPRERLPENQEIMLYRIIQEIVNNSLKHAEASKIDLTIIVHPDQLDISCSDNGKGFKRDEILEKKTIGIQSIHSRVRFLDGNICIDSSPGNGTVYRINIPVEPKE